MMEFRALMQQIRHQDILCFMHIPATGGSGVRHIFKTHANDGAIFESDFIVEPAHSRAAPRPVPKDARIVLGYFDRGIHHRLNRPPIYTTFLREPVARVISLYQLGRYNKAHFLFPLINSNGISFAFHHRNQTFSLISYCES